MYLIRVTRCETRGVLGGLDLCPFQQKNENENVLFVVPYLHQEDVFLTVEVETFLGNRSCIMNLRRRATKEEKGEEEKHCNSFQFFNST